MAKFNTLTWLRTYRKEIDLCLVLIPKLALRYVNPKHRTPYWETHCVHYTGSCVGLGAIIRLRKISIQPGFDSRTLDSVASRYTD